MSGKMECFGLTDTGRKRPANEDQFLIADLNKSMRVHQTSLGLDHQTRLFGNSQGKLLAVADGMGGHVAGQRASQLVVDSLVNYALNTLHWYFRLDADNDKDFRDDLKAALQHCQTMLERDVQATPQRRGMGTTLTLAYIIWPRMYVVHVGDSRCYLFRDGKLEQITRDHTMAQLLKESMDDRPEQDEPEDEPPSRWSNTLWNAISADDSGLEPDVYSANLEFGDTVLLCTDGLTKHVDKSRLIELLSSRDSNEVLCQRLIDEANSHGGSDNITVVLSRFQEATEDTDNEVAQAELPLEQKNPRNLDDTDPNIPDDEVAIG